VVIQIEVCLSVPLICLYPLHSTLTACWHCWNELVMWRTILKYWIELNRNQLCKPIVNLSDNKRKKIIIQQCFLRDFFEQCLFRFSFTSSSDWDVVFSLMWLTWLKHAHWCMCVCVSQIFYTHTHTHTCGHTHTHTHAGKHTHTLARAHKHTHTHTRAYTRVHTHAHTRTDARIHTHTHTQPLDLTPIH
jgi:hypothetical protein